MQPRCGERPQRRTAPVKASAPLEAEAYSAGVCWTTRLGWMQLRTAGPAAHGAAAGASAPDPAAAADAAPPVALAVAHSPMRKLCSAMHVSTAYVFPRAHVLPTLHGHAVEMT